VLDCFALGNNVTRQNSAHYNLKNMHLIPLFIATVLLNCLHDVFPYVVIWTQMLRQMNVTSEAIETIVSSIVLK